MPKYNFFNTIKILILFNVLFNFTCQEKPKSKLDYIYKDLGVENNNIKKNLSCDYSCKVASSDFIAPKGIENESNYCYLISTLQLLASIDRFYETFKKHSNNNKIAYKVFDILKKIRNECNVKYDLYDEEVKKDKANYKSEDEIQDCEVTTLDIDELAEELKKKNWLKEHGKLRKKNDPRDPSLFFKFLFKEINDNNHKLTSIIKESDLDFSYCFDKGNSFDNIDIACSIDNFKIYDPEVLVVVSVYNDKDLEHSITYKNYHLIIPKKHTHTSQELRYEATAFIVVRKNGCGGNHATVYVKRQNKWYHCNDDKVTPMKLNKIKKIIKSDDTVLIAYERYCKNKC